MLLTFGQQDKILNVKDFVASFITSNYLRESQLKDLINVDWIIFHQSNIIFMFFKKMI